MSNETKHTPGPWTLFEPNPEETTQLIGNGTIHIADIFMTDFPAGRADAALIAAAPELLEALKETLRASPIGPHVKVAQAAIAKAEGK